VRNAAVATAAAEALVRVDEQPHHLDTLAAAYAAGGRFDDAVRTAARAAELAERQHDATRLADIRRNLDRYRARLTAAR
jgi:spermidine synthase